MSSLHLTLTGPTQKRHWYFLPAMLVMCSVSFPPVSTYLLIEIWWCYVTSWILVNITGLNIIWHFSEQIMLNLGENISPNHLTGWMFYWPQATWQWGMWSLELFQVMVCCLFSTNSMFDCHQWGPVTFNWWKFRGNIDGLVQQRCNSIALAVELRLSCTNPSIYSWHRS